MSHEHIETKSLAAFTASDSGPVAAVSVASMDRARIAPGSTTSPVEARILVLSASGSEPELQAIRSVLDFRGVPYDVFVATAEPALTASRLQSGARGLYQATILTSSSLAISGTSALSSTEWGILADYEAGFRIRRAVLAAWPDPALGFGSATTRNTARSPLAVRCTTAGRAVFRDVNCGLDQVLNGDTVYLSTPQTGSPLTSLLADASGRALAAVHGGSDGRESLLLLFRNHPNRLHSQLFLHGVLGWVTGGTYLGERRIDLSAQVDDLFFAANLPSGGTFRLDGGDLAAALDWVNDRRATAITPDFHVSFAFNGHGAEDGDSLTEEVRAQSGEWFWINHTWAHGQLDTASYSTALSALSRNVELAATLPLHGFDVRDLVTPSVSGLVNRDAMRAAADVGIRYAVTDTSRDGCDNPSPNTAFYDVMEPRVLLVPRRPIGMAWNVSTPAELTDRYNASYRDFWGRDSTYAQVREQIGDVLIHYLLRGEADPWMFHQANLRAYDGVHSIFGDLLDTTLGKVRARSLVPVGTPPMFEIGARFARRARYDVSGARATLFRGRALVIDVAQAATVPVTGVRPADGESYGGDVIGLLDAVPGTSTCVPLDRDGLGCSPAPVREGGPGAAGCLPFGFCDASALDHPEVEDPGDPECTTGEPPPPPTGGGIARNSTWSYWDDGGSLSTSWRTQTAPGTGWESGPGPLGYGESYLRTTVSYGPSSTSKHVTTYFTRTFSVADPAAVGSMRGEVMYDDGFVVYLNGVEIGRAGLPAGTVSASTLSGGHEAANAYQVSDWTAARGALRAGTNVLSVEVHQAAASSSDLVFDLALVLDTSAPPPPPPAAVPRNATWSYWDDGGDLGTSWRTLSSPGTGWESGAGPLGYGESYLRTTVSYGPSSSSKHVTTYFLRSFSVADPAAVASMLGEVMYDDGFVVYLNGIEIGRASMPTGFITSSTLSTGHEAGNAYRTFDWSAARSALRAGNNVLAVEVHQAAASSSDLVFDLALRF